MSIKSEMERISNNVSDALAATAEMGATVPEGANSDNLGALIRSIPTGGGGDSVLRIYAKKSNIAYRQEIIEGGAAKTYTAAEIYELAKQKVIILETYTSRDSAIGKGYHQYVETSFASDGSVNQVHFRGLTIGESSYLAPSYVSLDNNGLAYVSDGKWAGSRVETDTTLTKNGFPADAKKVGDRLTALSEQIANSGGGSGASINVTAEVGQTIRVKEVDANGKPTAWEAAEYQPRTHWAEVAEILPETTVEIDPESGEGMALVDFALEPNKAYTIKYNGVEYSGCVGMELDGVMFGNLGVLDESLPVTEHPFILVSMAGDIDEDGNTDYVIGVIPLDGSTSVTLSIGGLVYHTIPREYLPESKSCTIDVVFGSGANVYLTLDLAASSELVNAILNGDPIYINSTVTNSGRNYFERLNGVPSIFLNDAPMQENNWNSIEDYINTFLMMGVSTNEIPITLTAWSIYMETGLTININQPTGD